MRTLLLHFIRVADYLLAPRLLCSLLWRHSAALLLFLAAHIVLSQLLKPTLTRCSKLIRRLQLYEETLRREEALQEEMRNAETYEEWRRAASDLDASEGLMEWKHEAISRIFDWTRIRDNLAVLRQKVDQGDVSGIMSFSRARLYRNLVNINDRRLYSVMRSGTKSLIEEYIAEVVRALQMVCVINSEQVSAAEKLAFFNETRHAFGRTALLLSGGATLGLYHTGVVKALHSQNLLPRVLSGASVGSIVVAMLGTRTDEEINTLFEDPDHQLDLNFFPVKSGSLWQSLKHLFEAGELMDMNVLRECVRKSVANLTFAEAYERSGRIISIVVSPAVSAGNQDSSRLLNYLTSPNVLVISAVLASCAIPGLFHSVELMCRDENGMECQWIEGSVGMKWEDGSVRADLPMERLRELFNINHFIVSQTNPHVVLFLGSQRASLFTGLTSPLAFVVPRLVDFWTASIKSIILNLIGNGLFPFQSPLRFVLEQSYVGDITLVPPVHWSDFSLLLTNPTQERLAECLKASKLQTYECMALIRSSCEIEMALDEGVRRMRGMLILNEVEEGRKIERLSRVRSWSSDFEKAGRPVQPLEENPHSVFARRNSVPLGDHDPPPLVSNRSEIALSSNHELRLPSTNKSTASRVSPLSRRDAFAALSHRSVGESVAHAYVLAKKSMHRARTQQNSPTNPSRHITVQTEYGALVPHRPRSRTPPAAANYLPQNVELSRQSSSRLQQLMLSRGANGTSAKALHRNGESPNADVLLRSPGGPVSLPLPSMVSFRHVEPRQISTEDLVRLGAVALAQEEDSWNAMMTWSDNEDDKEAGSSHPSPVVRTETHQNTPRSGMFTSLSTQFRSAKTVTPFGLANVTCSPTSLHDAAMRSSSHQQLRSSNILSPPPSTSPHSSTLDLKRSSSTITRNLSLNELASDLPPMG